jgi:hypothetical protein
MNFGKILLGVAAVVAAWKFGEAAKSVGRAQEIRAHGYAELAEAHATAIIDEIGLGADDDEEPTVH